MPICPLTSASFEIPPEEMNFLERITPKFDGKIFAVPLPLICPEERMRIRVAHRNERYYYHNTSALSGQKIVSLYSADKPVKVYTPEEWFGDGWEGLDYGRDFDFSRPFFEQFRELSLEVPKLSLMQTNNENTPYTTGTGYCKNCHLINSSEYCENCYYGKLLQSCTSVMDSSYAYDSELLYECFNVRNCYNCVHVYHSQNATDCSFSENLNGCKHCFLCTNLSQKNYYFRNKPCSKEEYQKHTREFQGYVGHQKALQVLSELRAQRICKYASIVNSENCSGDFIRNSKNCTECFDMNDSEDCKYVQVGVKVKDIMDCSNMYIKPELCYQSMSTLDIYSVYFSLHIFYSNDIWYSEHCFSCKNLFGCSGLKNKEYCVFNKQYTKEEYEKSVARIIEHMTKTPLTSPLSGEGPLTRSARSHSSLSLRAQPSESKTGSQQSCEWGQMFPLEHSLFAYNETLANEYLPLNKNQIEENGWKWHQPEEEDFTNVTKRIPAEKLPDDISDVPDDILSWAIECVETKKLFRLQKAELKFLRQMNLPFPRVHPDVRYDRRMQLRNPRKMYFRKCARCRQEIQSTYAPEHPETVYCEKCYLAEVY